MPVYNVEKYLCRCLNSLVLQTYSNIEIILIDDGSQDNSPDICDHYAAMDVRVKVKHIFNNGVSNARNVGLKMATGQYITFVDSDDWVDSSFIETWVKEFVKNDCDIFVGGYIEEYANGQSVKFNKCEALSVWNVMECLYNIFVRNAYRKGFAWSVWGKFFHNRICSDVLFSSELTVGEDAVWLWKVLKNTSMVIYVPYCGYHYFQRDDSVMHNLSLVHIIDDMKMYEFFYMNSSWYEDEFLHEYFKWRFYSAKVTTIIRLCLYTDLYEFMAIKKAEMLQNDLFSCVLAEWKLHKIRGICKLVMAVMSCEITSKCIRKVLKYIIQYKRRL